MRSLGLLVVTAIGGLCLSFGTAFSQVTYSPPADSLQVLEAVDFSGATAVDEEYRHQFTGCDGLAGEALKDTFRGHSMWVEGRPSNRQFNLCSRDPSRVEALLRLRDGAIYWESKMALDVDGSWAAWNDRQGLTDLKHTWMRWFPSDEQSAQVDPDVFPYVVIPVDGRRSLTNGASRSLGLEFRNTTGLNKGDMGVVILGDKWTPAFIADGGPFMRLGEGSSKVFEVLGESRCRRWNDDKTDCIGPAGSTRSPYINAGVAANVIFVMYPDSAEAGLNPDNAIAVICDFAERRLGLTGSETCADLE